MMSKRTSGLVAAGLAVCLLIGGGVSYFASGSPDGLNRVAADEGFDRTETDHGLADSPFAGYETEGVDQGWLTGGIAGIVGVGGTFLVAAGLVLLVRRRGQREASSPAENASAADRTGRPPA